MMRSVALVEGAVRHLLRVVPATGVAAGAGATANLYRPCIEQLERQPGAIQQLRKRVGRQTSVPFDWRAVTRFET
jgi:hypothetical protein